MRQESKSRLSERNWNEISHLRTSVFLLTNSLNDLILFASIYFQGCIKYDECKELEKLHRDDVCNKAPSKCTYCCKGDSKCNAYNSANSKNVFVNNMYHCAILFFISSYFSVKLISLNLGFNNIR